MNATATRPTTEEIWDWLDQVPDPEIPVISLVDLGIIRDVVWDDSHLVVTVTPTYSGCPATSVINFEIEKTLRDRGLQDFELKRQLSPAWTTAWISDKGRAKLREFGIAPPVEGTSACGGGKAPAFVVECPRCRSENTSLISQFGSTPCKSNYRCNDCLEPFDYFKCI